MPTIEHLFAQIPDELAGARVDQALAQIFPQYSRSRLTQWIKQGKVTVDGSVPRPKDAVLGGEQVALEADSMPAEQKVAAARPRLRG